MRLPRKEFGMRGGKGSVTQHWAETIFGGQVEENVFLKEKGAIESRGKLVLQ